MVNENDALTESVEKLKDSVTPLLDDYQQIVDGFTAGASGLDARMAAIESSALNVDEESAKALDAAQSAVSANSDSESQLLEAGDKLDAAEAETNNVQSLASSANIVANRAEAQLDTAALKAADAEDAFALSQQEHEGSTSAVQATEDKLAEIEASGIVSSIKTGVKSLQTRSKAAKADSDDNDALVQDQKGRLDLIDPVPPHQFETFRKKSEKNSLAISDLDDHPVYKEDYHGPQNAPSFNHLIHQEFSKFSPDTKMKNLDYDVMEDGSIQMKIPTEFFDGKHIVDLDAFYPQDKETAFEVPACPSGELVVFRKRSGRVKFVPAKGVTLKSANGCFYMAAPYGMVTLYQLGRDREVLLTGELSVDGYAPEDLGKVLGDLSIGASKTLNFNQLGLRTFTAEEAYKCVLSNLPEGEKPPFGGGGKFLPALSLDKPFNLIFATQNSSDKKAFTISCSASGGNELEAKTAAIIPFPDHIFLGMEADGSDYSNIATNGNKFGRFIHGREQQGSGDSYVVWGQRGVSGGVSASWDQPRRSEGVGAIHVADMDGSFNLYGLDIRADGIFKVGMQGEGVKTEFFPVPFAEYGRKNSSIYVSDDGMTIFIAKEFDQAIVSTDGGNTWARPNLPNYVKSLSARSFDRKVMYYFGGHRIDVEGEDADSSYEVGCLHKSLDGGATWTIVKDFGSDTFHGVVDLNNLYGLDCSKDGSAIYLQTTVVHGEEPNVAASMEVVWESTDGGNSFANIYDSWSGSRLYMFMTDWGMALTSSTGDPTFMAQYK